MLTVAEIHDAVLPLAERYGLDRVFLFGSYARGDATEKSDVDFRIDRGKMRGFEFGGLYEDMKEALQKDVDIMTTKQLDENFLSAIRGEEILIYDRN
ncbi:MAG: nucleotidyltransferase domain-containing protein [Schwartzia sp.]|nr:nucleotidyltransferase domain-containing protein [Schwartzia sp. (in: firmicutes)]